MVKTKIVSAYGVAWFLFVGSILLAGCSAASQDTAAGSAQMVMSKSYSATPATSVAAFASSRDSVDQAKSSNGTVTLSQNRSRPVASTEEITPTVRQVIRRADLEIRVDSVEKAEKLVSGIVQSAGGYTESASSTDLASTHPSMTIALRVPAGQFDNCISRFETLGVRLSKKVSSDDITGQLVDLDARLKTLRAQEEVYRKMLISHGQLNDVFNIQNKLVEVRTQIETIDGQRKSQVGLAALSSISLVLEQSAVASQAPTDPNWLAQTWAQASSGASASLRDFAVIVIWIICFSPFWIPVVLIGRRALKQAWPRKSEPTVS